MTDSDPVRYNVQMPEQLREDAKRNTDRGELAEEVRDVFRKKAYGVGASETPSELEQTRAELEQLRAEIDRLRHDRSQLEATIQSKEARANRLEERIDRMEAERDELSQSLDILENMLEGGERMWPTRIKNVVDVDPGTAEELYQELRERNSELPTTAFSEPGIHEDPNWKRATA